MTTLDELLRHAAEIQKRMWLAYEPIYTALGYAEFPGKHVVAAVARGVEEAALVLGSDEERITLFRVRKSIEENRALFVPEFVPEPEREQDNCVFCVRPFGAPGDDGKCPECLSKVDRSGARVRG